MFHQDGAAAVARAAREFGILQILSSVCLPKFEYLEDKIPALHAFLNEVPQTAE